MNIYFQNKLDYFNRQGWGYSDSQFILDNKRKVIKFSGDKYLYSGNDLPSFLPWVMKNIKIDIDNPQPA